MSACTLKKKLHIASLRLTKKNEQKEKGLSENLNKWSANLSHGEPASLECSDICPLVSLIHMRKLHYLL